MPSERPTSQPKRRHLWTRSLRFRLTIWYVGLMGLLLIAAGCVLHVEAQRALLAETDGFIGGKAHDLAAICSEGDDPPDTADLQQAVLAAGVPSGRQANRMEGRLVAFDVQYMRVVRAPAGAIVAQSSSFSAEPALKPYLDQLLAAALPVSGKFAFAGPDEERMLRVVTVPVTLNNQAAAVQVAVPWDHNADILEHLTALLTVCFLVVLLLAGLGGWVLVGRTLQPIGRIVHEAERLDAASLPERLIPDAAESDSEVGSLVVTLNRMMTRLRTAFDAQRKFAEAQQQFAADASHELRTPLTILRGEMDVALARPREAHAYRAVITSAVEEIDRMSRIVEGLTLLAECDGKYLDPDRRRDPVDVMRLALITRDELHAKAAAKGVALAPVNVADDTGAWSVEGDPEQIRLVLRNLVDNAVKYTDPGGQVGITLTSDTIDPETLGEVLVIVSDTGMGIASEELPHVFDRFWRSDRSRSGEGTGLGLAISKQVAEAHGGSLTVTSALEQGTRCVLCLPRHSP